MIRNEKENDVEKIWQLNQAAFEQDDEANLVNALRKEVPEMISLVYADDDQIVGHIAFTPVTLIGDDTDIKIVGLGPMAVHPDHQRKGIGGKLIRAGIEACRDAEYAAIIVLGHAEYYPKFGFVPSIQYDITWEIEVDAKYFMALPLIEGALDSVSGKIQYHPAFSGV